MWELQAKEGNDGFKSLKSILEIKNLHPEVSLQPINKYFLLYFKS